jgi:exopolysaccharide biosynthesis predicted pyruvyltransferase EpsI
MLQVDGTGTSGDIITRQDVALEALYREHVAPGQPYALLDFPNHANVGDSAIWAGERALLDRVAGGPPRYVCEIGNFDREALEAACPEGPVFLHGGGNFGDIWPAHQQFREHVLEILPERTVIQLPQSIKFFDEAAAGRMARLVQGRSRTHLYVRDERSLDFARSHFDCDVRLAPDSAFGLGTIPRHGTARWPIMALLRTDAEKVAMEDSAATSIGIPVVDWLEEDQAADRARLKAARIRIRLGNAFSQASYRPALYDALALERVRRGLRLLSSCDVLICDRLHAHILALLLDLPHVVLDNSYGKIWNYASAWTADYAWLRRAESLPHGISQARVLSAGLDTRPTRLAG